MKKRVSDEQIISILRGAEAGVSARDLCPKNAISDANFYTTLGSRSLAAWKPLR
ncbi:hypothetical protein C7433_110119 [Pantoea sp. PNA 03-3]|nr:hypothetical protein C7433_110119 [Pantoea sp. PNA 03-3]